MGRRYPAKPAGATLSSVQTLRWCAAGTFSAQTDVCAGYWLPYFGIWRTLGSVERALSDSGLQ